MSWTEQCFDGCLQEAERPKKRKRKKRMTPIKKGGHDRGLLMDPSVVPSATEGGEGDARYWAMQPPEEIARLQGQEETGGAVPQYIFPIVSSLHEVFVTSSTIFHFPCSVSSWGNVVVRL